MALKLVAIQAHHSGICLFRAKSRRKAKGVTVKIERSNPLKGVSGVFTLNSTLAAITRAKDSGGAL